MERIPKAIKELYQTNIINSIYLKLRWRLTKFKEIERFTPKKGKIVDLGCGFGLLSNYLFLNSKERNIIGIDSSKKRIKNAQNTVKENNIRFLEGNIIKKELPKADCFVLTDFLHHIPYTKQEIIIKKIYKALNKKGILIFQDINKTPRIKYYFTYLLDRSLNYGERVYYRQLNEWIKILNENNFKIDTIKKIDQGLPMPNILLIAIK